MESGVAEDSDLEKTEAPSSRRLEQAREEGQVPQSRELSTFFVTITGVLTLWLLGGWMAEHFGWRNAFFAVGAPGIILALIVPLLMSQLALLSAHGGLRG